ncbi:MAG: pyridoxamine 5'-phosphate oxidase family protein [Rudaea sp.]
MKDQTAKQQIGQELVDRAWHIAKSIRTSILITRDGDKSRARPMSAHVEQPEHAIYFLADASGQSLKQIEAHASVSVVFSDESANSYVAFVGSARVSDDRAKIKELWSVFAKAWWESADDPSIRLITVRPSEAEIWDGPNKLVAGAIMIAAAITGDTPAVGDHAKLKV